MKNLEKFKNLGEILSKAQQKKILGGYGDGESYKCCWIEDVVNGDYSNCSACTSGSSWPCGPTEVKVACWYS